MEYKSAGKKMLIAGIAFSFTFALGGAFAEEAEQIFGSQALPENQTVEATVGESDSTAGSGTDPELAYISPYSMYSYKHYWGAYHGNIKATLYWSAVKATSRVFASCSEGHMGSAKYTVHNVVPGNGYVQIWAYINWSSNIRLYCDYLVIN